MLTSCHSKVLLSLSSSSQTLRVAVLRKTSDECRPAPMQEKGCVDTAVVCYVPHQLFSPSPLLAPPPRQESGGYDAARKDKVMAVLARLRSSRRE